MAVKKGDKKPARDVPASFDPDVVAMGGGGRAQPYGRGVYDANIPASLRQSRGANPSGQAQAQPKAQSRQDARPPKGQKKAQQQHPGDRAAEAPRGNSSPTNAAGIKLVDIVVSPSMRPILVSDLKYLNAKGIHWGPARLGAVSATAHGGAAIARSDGIDVVFLLDGTGSMAQIITKVKDNIEKIVDNLRQTHANLKLRVAIVVYRDFDYEADRQLEVMDFTEDLDAFKAFLRAAQASHAPSAKRRDTAEDVLSGLHALEDLSWEQGRRAVFHACDAPCHGRRFHDMSARHDHYLDLPHPKALTAEAVLQQTIAAKGLDYHFARINASTDKMVSVFDTILDPHGYKVMSHEVGGDVDLVGVMEASLHHTLSSGNMDSNQRAQLHALRQEALQRVDLQAPQWHTVTPESALELRMDLPKNVVHLQTRRCDLSTQRHVSVRVWGRPMAVGSCRQAYRAQLMTPEGHVSDMMAKVHLEASEAADLGCYMREMEAHSIAAYLANAFSAATRDCPQALAIKFGICRVVILLERETQRYAFLEPFIQTQYVKFVGPMGDETRDGRTKAKDVRDTVQAFMHFSYERSGQYLLVGDLQGTVTGERQQGGGEGGRKNSLFLTDPVVHCSSKERFDHKTNSGQESIDHFFRQHRCNAVCRHLRLESHSTTIAEDEEEEG